MRETGDEVEINVNEVSLLNKFAKKIHYPRLDKSRTHNSVPFLIKLFHHTEERA